MFRYRCLPTFQFVVLLKNNYKKNTSSLFLCLVEEGIENTKFIRFIGIAARTGLNV